MRKDAGVDGDAQRISQMVWMIFLKIFDDREAEWEILEDDYKSPIPEALRWRNWAAEEEGITGDTLLDFVDNALFKTLKTLSLASGIDQRGYVVRDDLKFTVLQEQEFQELKLFKEDLLMIRSNGSKSLVGRTAVVGSYADGYAYAGYLVRIRLLTQYTYSKYLHLALETNHVREQIEIPIRTTTGVKNINSTEIYNLIVPLPPLAEQKRIITKLNQLMSLCDALETKLTQSVTDSEKLMEAAVRQILAANSNKTDKHESALLESIHAETTKPENKTAGRRNKKNQGQDAEAVQLNLPLF